MDAFRLPYYAEMYIAAPTRYMPSVTVRCHVGRYGLYWSSCSGPLFPTYAITTRCTLSSVIRLSTWEKTGEALV